MSSLFFTLNTIVMLGGFASAVDIAFMSGTQCNLPALSGTRNISSVACYDLTLNLENASSVDFRNFDLNQRVRFFSDTKCTAELYAGRGDGCYTPSEAQQFAAFTVSYDNNESKETVSDDSQTTDVVPYGMKLADYKGLQYNPYSIDIAYSKAFIGLTSVRTAAAISLATVITGCFSAVTSPSPLGIFGCAASMVATVLAFVGGELSKSAGANIQANIAAATGTIDDTGYHRKRDLINARNFEFTHGVLNATGSGATFTGLHMRRGEQTSPIYTLDHSPDGQIFHLTAFHDEDSGSPVFHLAASHEVHKRQDDGAGYDNVRWSANGVDFSVCNYAPSASRSVFQQSSSSLYDTFYGDLSCYYSGSSTLQDSKQLVVDMYNGDSIIVAGVNIAPYQDGGPVNNNAYVVTQCTKTQGTVSTDCIN